MNEKSFFEQFDFVRARTFHICRNISDEESERIPEGFSNNIKWNIGHIVVTQDFLINRLVLQRESLIPKEMTKLFKMGSSPKEWNQKAPTLEELFGLLKSNAEQLKELLTDKLDHPLENHMTIGSYSMKTVDELFSFTLFHEGIHQGVIQGLKYTVQNKPLQV